VDRINILEPMARSIAFTVKGKVQGVGFRDYAQRTAKKLQLSGWVANSPSGDVQGEAAGEESNVKAFEKALEQGPSGSRVTSLDLTKEETLEDGQGIGSQGVFKVKYM